MRIWIPNVIYQAFPLLSVITGFLVVMFIHTSAGIVMAALLYVYSFSVLWLREADDNNE